MKSKKQIARFEAIAAKWLLPMGLLNWRKCAFVYIKDQSHFQKEGYREAAMITHASWPYLEATIEINLYALAEASDEEIEYWLVHELVHVLTEEMEPSRKREDNVERVVTQLARAFLAVAEGLPTIQEGV